MTGMMIAMTIGMLVGLTIGVVLGIIYSGNLFASTLLAMGIGLIIGFLAGVPVSVMAVLDGMLAGIMGGMMGAMLGEMIAAQYTDTLVKIMFVLFVGIFFILLYMMQQELSRKKEPRKPLFHNPLFMMAVLATFFFGYNQLGVTVSKAEQQMDHDNSMDMNSMNQIMVQADEFAFSPGEVTIAAGEMVTLTLKNTGNQEHDLSIAGLNADVVESSGTMRNDAHGEQSHGNSGQSMEGELHLHTKPGEVQTITFIPLQPGTYKMVCTLPGHKEAGMVGIIKVTR